VDGSLIENDPDSATLAGASVAITGGFAAGDTLGFVNQLGITGSYNSATGVLTLSGNSQPSDYQVALRSVTFSTGASASAGTRTISFTANDGLASGNTATKDINVTASGGGSLAFNSSVSSPLQSAISSAAVSPATSSSSSLTVVASASTMKRSSVH